MAITAHSIRAGRLHTFRYVFLAALIFSVLTSYVAANGDAKKTYKKSGSNLNQVGRWEPAFSSGVIVHATVLPDGNVLHWSSFEQSAGGYGPYTRLWECRLVNGLCNPNTPSREDLYYTATNVYCSGHTIMSDGRVMITGGTLYNTGYDGDKATTIFDYRDVRPPGQLGTPWIKAPDMFEGRWYPTTISLGDGRVLTASGTYCEGRDPKTNACYAGKTETNFYPEILDAAATHWDRLEGAKLNFLPLYPWLYYASNGKVFYAGPTEQSRWLDIQGEGGWINGPISSAYRESGSAVMYDTDKVMISGGGPVVPTNTVELIDLGAANPAWRGITNGVAPMVHARKHHNLTILADGKVLVTGGTSGIGFNNNCRRRLVREAEMWNPQTETWTTMAPMQIGRRYHSTAVLLIDGRVLSAGSDQYPSRPIQCSPTIPGQNQTEIYTPPYLFNPDGSLAARPTIQTAPVTPISYGTPFLVGMTNATEAADISKVTMIRLSSVTHSMNMNQRINHPVFRSVGSSLEVNAPANSNLCPKGHYMLFAINSAGVPSVAKVVQIL